MILCPAQCVHPETLVHLLYFGDIDLDHLTKVLYSKFLYCKGTRFTLKSTR